MSRSYRSIVVILVLFLLSMPLLACGPKPAPQPTAVPQATEVPRPTAGPAGQTAVPAPPGPADPPASVADVNAAYESIQRLPGYHSENTFRSQSADGSSTYIRTVRDVDAQGNFYLAAWNEEEGQLAFEMYYVNQHIYMGQGGQFVDLGAQPIDQASAFYQIYDLPFTMALIGAGNLQPVGKETVNGLACTKYRADFEQWVKMYLQAKAGVSYSSEGYLWISDQYGAIVKSSVQATLTEEGQTSNFSSEGEISQVGQVGPIQVP